MEHRYELLKEHEYTALARRFAEDEEDSLPTRQERLDSSAQLPTGYDLKGFKISNGRAVAVAVSPEGVTTVRTITFNRKNKIKKVVEWRTDVTPEAYMAAAGIPAYVKR